MGKYIITGGNRLSGEVVTSGAKNAVLPMLAALPLIKEASIYNVPFLSDVANTIEILESTGVKIAAEGSVIHSEARALKPVIDKELSCRMRSSVLFLGSMLSACGEVEIAYPGGCALGARPVDIHIWAMKMLGAEVYADDNMIHCKAKKLKGAEITLPVRSVGVTENIILAAARAEGTTIIKNGAREPEICNLCDFMNKCGADIYGYGTDCIRIKGVKSLHPCSCAVIPDRIEAATYMIMAAATGGELFIRNVNTDHIRVICALLRKCGCIIKEFDRTIYIEAPRRPYSVSNICTAPYPYFPTDVQPQIMALMSIADGQSFIRENIFSGRYKHAEQLNKMGADIEIIDKRTFMVRGVKELRGAEVNAWDLRGGAALIVAGLCTEGTTLVNNREFVERGYESPVSKIRNIGGKIMTL